MRNPPLPPFGLSGLVELPSFLPLRRRELFLLSKEKKRKKIVSRDDVFQMSVDDRFIVPRRFFFFRWKSNNDNKTRDYVCVSLGLRVERKEIGTRMNKIRHVEMDIMCGS